MARPHSITVYGDAQVDTAIKKIGTGSLLLDGTDSLRAPNTSNEFDLIGDFTVEFWAYFTTVPNSSDFDILVDGRSSGASQSFAIYANNSKIRVNAAFSGTPRITSNDSLTANTWTHIALVRSSGTWTLYLNGSAQTGTYSNSSNIALDTDIVIGARFDFTANGMKGHIDEFRWSTTARYTSNFTPSTTAFSSDADTELLLHMDGTDGSTTFTDDDEVGGVTHEGAASLSSAFTQPTTDVGRIRPGAASFSGAFTPSMTVNVSRAGEVDLYAASDFSATVSRVRQSDVTLSTIVTLNIQAAITADGASSPSSAFDQTVAGDRIRTSEFTAAVSFDLSAAIEVIITGAADFGAAFTPTITAVASKNGSIDAASSTTFAATGLRIHPGASDLSSATTLSANGGRLEIGSATFSSTTTLSADAISYTIDRPFNRPNDIEVYTYNTGANSLSVDNTAIEYNTADKIEGTYAGNWVDDTGAAFAVDIPTQSIGSNDDFFLSFAVDLNDDNNYTNNGDAIVYFCSVDTGFPTQTSSASDNYVETDGVITVGAYVQANDEDIYPFLRYRKSNGTYTQIVSSTDFNNGVKQLTVRRSGSTISLMSGNTVLVTDSYSGAFYSTFDRVTLWRPEKSQNDPSYDKFIFALGTSGTSTPLSAYTPTEETVFYHRFEQSIEDTLGITIQGDESLSAAFTQTAQGSVENIGSASLSAAFTMTVDAGEIIQFASLQASAGTLEAEVGVIKQFDTSLSAAFTSSADINITAAGASSLSSTATQSADVNVTADAATEFDAIASQVTAVTRIAGLLVEPDSAFTQTADVNVIRDADSTQNATFSQIAVCGAIRRTAISLTTVVTQNADNTRLRGYDAALDTTATLESEIGSIKQFEVDVTSAFTPTFTINLIEQLSATLSGAFTPTLTVNVQTDTGATLTTSTALTADVDRVVGFGSDLSSSTSLGVDIEKILQFESSLSSTATQTASASRTRSSGATLLSAGGFEIDVNIIGENEILLVAQTLQTASGARIRFAEAQFETTATQTTNGIKAVEASATLDSAGGFTIDVVATRAGEIELASEFGQTTTANAQFDNSAVLASALTVDATIGAIKQFAVDITGAFTPTINAGLTAEGAIELALTTQLTATGAIIVVDRVVYTIPKETRFYTVPVESRSHTIHQETRTYTLEEEA